jgi:hypothetical protein
MVLNYGPSQIKLFPLFYVSDVGKKNLYTGIRNSNYENCYWRLKIIQEMYKGKGKFQHRAGHEGPQGKQRCSSTLSLTSALDWVGVAG